MIFFDEFIKKWDGKLLDFDGKFSGQCVDVFRMYVKEVLNFPQSPSVTGAADIWTTCLKDYFKQITNTPDGIPQKGDIVVWCKTTSLPYGHVAIFIEGDDKKFTSFDQNFPITSLCHLQDHNYRSVLGWLQPIKKENDLNWLVQMFSEIGIDVQKVEGDVRGRVQEMFDGYKKYGELEKRIAKLEKDLAGAEGSSAEYETRLRISEQGRERLEKEVSSLRDSISFRETEIGKLNDQVKLLQDQIAPDKNLIISKEEYIKLTARRVLDRFGNKEIVLELIKRVLRWVKVWRG